MPTRRDDVEVRRRPKDRKAQIARAAAEAFSAQGYHAVGMDEIAAQVGITATALYRHYRNKYQLFREAVLGLAQQLVDATDFADARPAADPASVFAALADVAVHSRASGGLYRWEWRYLLGEDRAELLGRLQLVHRRIQRALSQTRPQLTPSERWVLSTSALSVIGSVVDHRVPMTSGRMRALLVELAVAVTATDLRFPAPAPAPPEVRPVTGSAGTRDEALLHHALTLFNKQGYRETGMGEIAAAAGVPTSTIYRHFTGKLDILTAVFRRAADQVTRDLAAATEAHDDDPAATLLRLVAAYVASSFANPELGYVYYTERVNLPPADQRVLRDVQRATVSTWVKLLRSARTDLSAEQARFAVHAAMALVIDVGRLVSYDDSARVQALVCRLMAQTLGI